MISYGGNLMGMLKDKDILMAMVERGKWY